MIKFLASSGHNLYLKCAYIYLQNMLPLHETHPEVYTALKAGDLVKRQSEHNYSGLFNDLVIELNGVYERIEKRQRYTKWLLSMPICLQMNSATQEFSQMVYKTSEQHKETTKSRVSRDSKDMQTMMAFPCERYPFESTEIKLRNFESGVTADDSANVDRVQAIGEAIVRGMIDTSQQKYTFKRSLQAVPMNERSLVKLDGEGLHIDTQLLFQRLATADDMYIENISSIFEFELSSLPSSLFDNNGFPRSRRS